MAIAPADFAGFFFGIFVFGGDFLFLVAGFFVFLPNILLKTLLHLVGLDFGINTNRLRVVPFGTAPDAFALSTNPSLRRANGKNN